MPIEYVQYPGKTVETVIMTACPFCGYEFDRSNSGDGFVHHRPRCPNLTDDGEVIEYAD
jgi:hypothetical protein